MTKDELLLSYMWKREGVVNIDVTVHHVKYKSFGCGEELKTKYSFQLTITYFNSLIWIFIARCFLKSLYIQIGPKRLLAVQ